MSVDLSSSRLADACPGTHSVPQPSAAVRRHGRQRPNENVRKREQIVRGARAVFLQFGFDGASVEDLVRAAGVSKGTLYLYFDSKEHLFQAVCATHAAFSAGPEQALDGDGGTLREVLIEFGMGLVRGICRPDRIAFLRMLIAVAGRMPELGRCFQESTLRPPIARLADFLARQVDAGVLAIKDCELAAEQLIEACHSTVLTPVIFGADAAPSQERIHHVVSVAVDCFLAGYASPRQPT